MGSRARCVCLLIDITTTNDFVQMIRKCNTSNSKQAYSPYHAIRVSEFQENEEERCEAAYSEDTANEELNLNILKIKQCKQETEQFLSEMNHRLNAQNQTIRALQARSHTERQEAKNIRAKYHEAMLALRRKDEENERLERCLAECRERYEFVVSSASSSTREWVEREDKYKRQIAELESFLFQSAQASLSPQRPPGRGVLTVHESSLESGPKEEESTFI